MFDLSGCDIVLQLKEALLNIILRQNFDAEQQAKETAAGGQPFWNVESSDPVFRMRFLQSPSLHLLGTGLTEVLLPENLFEAEKTFGNGPHAVTVLAKGTCKLNVKTTLTLVESASSGKVDVVLRQGDITIELLTLTLGQLTPTPEQRQAVQTLIQNRLAGKGDEMLNGKVVSQLDLTGKDIDISQFHLQVGLGKLAIFASKTGTTPDEIVLVSTESDLAVGVSAAMILPRFQAQINDKTVGGQGKELNDHYRLYIRRLDVSLIEGGLKMSGKAVAVGHGNHWYEPDWLYADIDADINKIVLSYRAIRQPDGYFEFEKTEEDVDVDNCDVFRMVLAGIFTFGIAWGASPGWVFFPLGGYIAGVASILSMKDEGLSSVEMAPDLPTTIKGVAIQFTDASFGETGVALFGDQTDDLASSSSALTSQDSTLRILEEPWPEHLPTHTRMELKNHHLWKGNRRYQARWRVDGKVVAEGPLEQYPGIDIGPINTDQARSHQGRVTTSLELLENDDHGTPRLIYQMERRMPVVGPFGDLQSCYLHNKTRLRLHLSVPGAHCYQVALAFRGNLGWDLPYGWGNPRWRTCPDCFGRGVEVAEVVDKLNQYQAEWRANPTLKRTWQV